MRPYETNKPFTLRDFLVWCLSQNGATADAKLIEKALQRVVSILRARRRRNQHGAIPDSICSVRDQRIHSPVLLLTLAADNCRKYGSSLALSNRDAVDDAVKSALAEYDLIACLAVCAKVSADHVERCVISYQQLRTLADEFVAAAKPRELANLAVRHDFDSRIASWHDRRAWTPTDRLMHFNETFVSVLGCRDAACELIASIGEARLMTLLDCELIDTALNRMLWESLVAAIRRRNRGERDPLVEPRLQMLVADLARHLVEQNHGKPYSVAQAAEAIYSALEQIDHAETGHLHTQDFHRWLSTTAATDLGKQHYQSMSRWKKLPPRHHVDKPFGEAEAQREQLTARACWLHFLLLQTERPQRGWAQFLLRAEETDALSYETMSSLLALMDVRMSPEALRTHRCRMLRAMDAMKLVFELDEWGASDAGNVDAIVSKLAQKSKRAPNPQDLHHLRAAVANAILAASAEEGLLSWASAASVLIEPVHQDPVLAAARTIEDLSRVWKSGGGEVTGELSLQVITARLAGIRQALHQDPGKLQRLHQISRRLRMKDLESASIYATILLGYSPEKTMKMVKFDAPADARAFQSLLEAVARTGDEPDTPVSRDRER